MTSPLYFTSRVVRKIETSGADAYGIHELFYDSTGMLSGYTVEPLIGPFASLDDLQGALTSLLTETPESLASIGSNPEEVRKWNAAAKKPVIDFQSLPRGKRFISSPSPDPDDPLAMEMVLIGEPRSTHLN